MERIIERNPANGQIEKAGLSSETAREMASRRWEKEKDFGEDLTALLSEAGYADPSEAPTYLRLLAEQAAAGGARSVQAVVQFMRATREKEEQGAGKWDYPNGLPCPTCGRGKFDFGLPPDLERRVWETLRELTQGMRGKP